MTSFPQSFVWGASTAAHQVEGGNTNSDWWQLEHAEGSWCKEPSGDACDSYHRYAEDIDLLASAGLTSYRFSVEWARIEPAPGEFSVAALDHYQRVVDACHARGVEPLVTLHHFTIPRWMREAGGWSTGGSGARFARYVDRVLARLDGVRRICTINEPNMIATWSGSLAGHASGTDPRPDQHLTEVLSGAHAQAVDVARSHGIEAGLTVAMAAYTTDGSAEADRAVENLRGLDEDPFLEAARHGDFLGVQAYSRRFATAAAGVLPQGHDFDGPATRQTLTGWNYYPQSVGDCLRRAHALTPGLPLVVTENGIATADDEERIAYTAEALQSVLGAIQDGAPVEGYFHWSLLDNFEWMLGNGPTFGLVSVDRSTFVRTPKPSLDWLGRVAKSNALPA
jgi:beta-glucosidase